MNGERDRGLRRAGRAFLAAGIAGVALAVVLGIADVTVLLRGTLTAFVFWIGFPLGCAGLLMIHPLTGGGWGWSLRRLFTAALATLPLFLVFLVPLIAGMGTLYPWAEHPSFHEIGIFPRKAAWFNAPFFGVRAAVWLAVWVVGALALRRLCRREERGEPVREALKRLSAGGLVVYFFTASFALIDWVGSLEAHWYSSIYGLYLVLAQGLAALAFLIVTLILATGGAAQGHTASGREETGGPGRQHILNDLGNLLLALVMLQAYLAFSQWLIIWNGNLPREITWYLRRSHGGWQVVFVLVFLLQFAFPFAGLLFQRVKRSRKRLLAVAGSILLGAPLHACWLVLPSFEGSAGRTVLVAALLLLGIGGLWLFFFLRAWEAGGERFVSPPPAPAASAPVRLQGATG